jgi:MFS family permease
MASSESASGDDKMDYAEDTKDVEELSASPVSPDEENALQKTVTPLTPPAPATPPDGGGRAWLQVLGSFLCFSNLWGFTFAFGSFQTYYEITYLPNETASTISWIGTVATFLLIVGGVISGPFFDLGYYRTMLFLGAGIETLAVFMTSLCGGKFYQLFLAQGILMGLGNGLLYVPGLALVGRSFKKHRSIAMAITTCGAPTGGVIYTLIFEQLIGKLSFGWTVRIMGFVMLGSYLISFPLLLFRADNVGNLAQPGTKRKLIDPRAFKDLPFCWYTISNFFLFLGYMIPFIFLASYGQQALGLSRSFSLYAIMIAQASSIVGRIVAGWSAARVGVMIPWIICATSSGILSIAWSGVHDRAGYIVYAALYGCFSGALIPLPPSIFPIVCPDPKVLGARLGMAQGIGSIASLIGSPIAGALATINAADKPGHTNYLGLQLFCGLTMVFGSCNLVGLWILLVKRRNLGKFI